MVVAVGREEDGRWIAEVVEAPAAIADGATGGKPVSRVGALVLRWRADRHRCGEPAPEPEKLGYRRNWQSKSDGSPKIPEARFLGLPNLIPS